MGNTSFFEKLIPLRFRKSVPVVHHIVLNGAIGIGTPLKPALTLKSLDGLLARAFRRKGLAAVAISINSPGGSIYSGLAILDTMQMIPNKISTVAVGVTASFGTVLLAGGAKGQRYALPHATIHMHQPLGGAEGQATDIEIMAHEIMRLKNALNSFFADVTGQPIEVIRRDTERDFFLTAEQAVSYGIVDKVLQPPVK